jgi:hypothetical protein
VLREWEVALADMEDRLSEGWKALGDGRVDIRPFEAPTGLGPVPVELRARAERVLEETRAFETALTQRSEAVARQLVMSRRATDAPRAAARFVDRTM